MDEARIEKKLRLRDALDHQTVRDLLWEIIGMGQVFNEFGPQTTDYFIGKRDLALEIVHKIEQESFDHWIMMQMENRKVEDE